MQHFKCSCKRHFENSTTTKTSTIAAGAIQISVDTLYKATQRIVTISAAVECMHVGINACRCKPEQTPVVGCHSIKITITCLYKIAVGRTAISGIYKAFNNRETAA